MGSYSDMGKAIESLILVLLWIAVISVPLAIWKIVDITVWVCRHVHFGVQ